MPSHPTSTMSESFFTHGLAGIDAHHAELRRTLTPNTISTGTSPLAQVRQLVASAFISVGTLLAGKELARSTGNRLAT